MQSRIAWLILLLPVLLQTAPAYSAPTEREIVPELARKAGFINVKERYGAKGDGVSDDTDALQRALSEYNGTAGGTLYLPAGTYLVSRRLEWRTRPGKGEWRCWVGFQGQSREQTVIKLRDRCNGASGEDYSNAEKPRAILHTATGWIGSDGDGGGRNDAYHNNIRDLTLDTGRGNPGAIGIDHMCSNQGVIENVRILSSDPERVGWAGIAMRRGWPGPGLLKNVEIIGFDYGFYLTHANNSMTAVGLTVRDQRKAGVYVDLNVLSLEHFHSVNRVPALMLVSSFPKEWGRFPLVTLLDGLLEGQAPDIAAIQNHYGYLYLRNVRAPGYGRALQNLGRDIPEKGFAELLSDPAVSLFPSPARPLNLPVENAPYSFDPDPKNWVSIAETRAKPDDDRDDTAAIQAAIDRGKPNIVFPAGVYHVRDSILVRGKVRHLMLSNSILLPAQDHQFTSKETPRPVFRFEKTDASVPFIIFERFESRFAQGGEGAIFLEQATSTPLIIRSGNAGSGYAPYRSQPGAGPLFLEDVTSHTHNVSEWQFLHPQKIWARQFNPEMNGPRMVVNRGATLWILGMKVEDSATVIETLAGGRTELLGGFLYPAGANPPPDRPAFLIVDSSASLLYANNGSAPAVYETQIREVRRGVTRELKRSEMPGGKDRVMPWYLTGPPVRKAGKPGGFK